MKRQTWIKTPLWLTVALLVCCLISAWLAVHGFYFSLFVALCLTAFVAHSIYRYILRSARAMAQFIWSVRYSEFLSSSTSNPNTTQPLPEELLAEMQDALEHYRSNLQKKESQLQYFQALANHIDMAILVYTPDGQMEWINEAAKRLIHREHPRTVDDLADFHPDLPAKLHTLKAGDLSVWQIKEEEETVQLALSGMEFIIQGRKLLIAGMKNIHSALDSRETEAWQKLIRVLTHEIMNSITPIISLTELLTKYADGLEGDEETKTEIKQMLQTIGRRGSGLVRFMNSYREVSHLPQPLLKLYSAEELLGETVQLMQNETSDLHLSLPAVTLRFIADKEQIEQVLINLIRNARENEATQITLSAGITPGNHLFLRVTDNGTGIEPEVQERIFIPFFTTKPTGSGIGLTISRQIMHQHHGSIAVQSKLGEGSTFTLRFPVV
ncbi:sensor histidine kinase [Bacteroides stercorirosoris]|uniref:histidine kinase n=1 Tax=Bacteroides stercorirosoris TaxID=871324 RepID=A0A1M6FNE4_9BACE|nr:PAS domain-containing sensor histidine kinase [Bacteroides stercorirosoris]SHI99200.1 Histidine kinase-, DNA gyrase B-, and HSP90-like ATPase [Bacteroides stercorirosoris]